MSVSPLVWIKAHQTAVALAGAGGVAGLALARKRKSSSGGGAAAPAVANTSTSDLYNALQPQLEQLTGAIQAADARIAVGANSQMPGSNPWGSIGSNMGQLPPPAPPVAPPAPPVSTSTPAPIAGVAPPTAGIVQTPQGFYGEFIPPTPGISYGGVVDLVDPRTGLASISGIDAGEASKYAGYTVVPHGSAPAPRGEG